MLYYIMIMFIIANRRYFELMLLFNWRLLSRKTKITLYKILVRPAALYAGVTWATTKSNERKLKVFEKKILRKIFGPKRNNEREYKIKNNEELKDLYDETNVAGTLKSMIISWA